jgi:hypothetical protein
VGNALPLMLITRAIATRANLLNWKLTLMIVDRLPQASYDERELRQKRLNSIFHIKFSVICHRHKLRAYRCYVLCLCRLKLLCAEYKIELQNMTNVYKWFIRGRDYTKMMKRKVVGTVGRWWVKEWKDFWCFEFKFFEQKCFVHRNFKTFNFLINK